MKTVTYDENLWQVVPKEPTDAMCRVATADTCWENMNPPPYPCYKAMLSVAPALPEVGQEPVAPEYLTEIGRAGAVGVVWFDKNPHAYLEGTLFYAAAPK